MYKYIIVLLLFTCSQVRGQVNLVHNPSFEEYSQCPYQYADQIHLAQGWKGLDTFGSGLGIPEYIHICDTTGYNSFPSNFTFYQYPRTGNAMTQVQMFFDETYPEYYTRDYLMGTLQTQLTDGQYYCVSFYVSLANLSENAINRIGAYLDNGSIDTVDSCSIPLVQYTPQVHAANIIDDTLNWIRIEGTFISNGTEQFITIGNFFDFTNTSHIPGFGGGMHYTWYLVDDVSVIPSDLPAYAGPDTWVALGDSVYIGRTPEIGLECKWYTGGNLIDSGAGIWVHPTVTTTYVVEQTLCGLVKTDTVTVEVWPAGVTALNYGKYVSIYPNPATTQLTIQMDKPVFTSYTISNSIGQQQLSQTVSGKETVINISELATGIYFLSLESESGKELRRFVKL